MHMTSVGAYMFLQFIVRIQYNFTSAGDFFMTNNCFI